MARKEREGRHRSARDYVSYQAKVARRHLLPLLRSMSAPLDRPILDVGCGTGGMVLAIASQVPVPVHGIDIDAGRIEAARAAAREARIDASFDVVDIVREPLPNKRHGLVLLRDVVEHLRDLPTALRRLAPTLGDGGMLYVTFPPWYGPYAGHQHNATGFAKFLPYAHCAAPGLFLSLLERREADRRAWLADQRQIFTNRLTREKFERTALEVGWRIHHRQTYFVRPALMRSGLPTIANGFVGRLPFIGESLTTACEYLLVRDPVAAV